jgi:DNA-binding NarL/FixJ family response regulator
VVDDHELFVDALARRLEIEPSVELVGRANSTATAMRALGRATVDVVIVDADLDGDDGMALVASIVSQELAPAVVVVTGHETVEVAARAVRAGAKGFVSKLDHTEELVDTVRAVHQGETRLPNRLLAGILAELQRAAREDDELVRRLALLTDREREVLAYLAAGTDRAAIARELFISAHTVRTHVQRILTKLGVHSQLEAVSVALRAGLRRPRPAEEPPPTPPSA